MALDESRDAAARSNAFLAERIRHRLADFESHCASSPHDGAMAWRFAGGPPSPLLQGHAVFGDGGPSGRIHLLDLYHGRVPTLFNSRTLNFGPDVRIGLRPFVIFDSNALSYVNRYLCGNLSGPIETAVHDFLHFMLTHNLDPNPVFYLMESIARSEPSRWREFAGAFAGTITDLQTLDRDIFLSERRLASSLRARRDQSSFHGVDGVGELIDKYTSSITREVVAAEEAQIARTYAALLKAMLLRQMPAELPDRQESLGTFMAERLGAVLGIERFAAILHWSAPEQFAGLLTPVQAGSNAVRALDKARSTAWDIYLGRLPEQLGKFISSNSADGIEATCSLFYLATGEEALAKLLGHRTIELLVQHADSSASSIVVGHQAGLLEEVLTPAELIELSDRSLAWEQRVHSTAHLRSPVGGAALDDIVAELEGAVRVACEPRAAP